MRKSLREHSLGLFFYMKYCELILLDIMYNDILVFFFERHAHVAVLGFTDPFCEVRSFFLCHVPCSRKCRNFLNVLDLSVDTVMVYTGQPPFLLRMEISIANHKRKSNHTFAYSMALKISSAAVIRSTFSCSILAGFSYSRKKSEAAVFGSVAFFRLSRRPGL